MSERLGHAKVSITLDVYSHAVPTLQREAARRLAALVFGEPTPMASSADVRPLLR